MDHCIPGKVGVLRESAPQMVGIVRGRIAIPPAVGIGAPVGGTAETILAEMTPLALEAWDVVLDEDQIAFLDAFAFGELSARFGDVADVFMTHDHRTAGQRL